MGFWVKGLGFELQVECLRFGVQGLRFKVTDIGFRV
jgi:hypothetical protein